MAEFTLLILVGPCLMTALAAAGLFLAWRHLSRARHILAWSGAFTTMALAIVARALASHPDGHASVFVAALVQSLGIVTTMLLTEGFADRAGRPGLIRRTLGIWLALLAVTVALYVAGPSRSLANAWAALAQAAALLWSAWIMVRGGGASVAELTARTVLIAVGLLRLWTAGVAAAGIAGWSMAAGNGWLPPLMIEPAAVGLLAMFLIATDLSVDLNRLACTDPLTGVMNRAGFEDAATGALRRAQARRRPLSIAIADIDRFKAINDVHGHAAGDAVLSAFAGAIVAAAGERGLVGRIGGEEFALVLPQMDTGEALATVEPLRLRTAALAIAGYDGVRLTASFGIAQLLHGETLPGLLARADSALYRSKHDGRNRCTLAAEPAVE